jgi:Cytochrome C'
MRHRLLCAWLALAGSVVLVGAGGGQSDLKSDKSWDHFVGKTAAQKEILALARLTEAGKSITRPAAALKSRHEKLAPLMQAAYRPREKKGIGIGTKSPGDAIESKIIDLGKRPPTAAVLKNESTALIKMGYINMAMAEIVRGYAPAKPRGTKGKKDWEQHAGSMKKASEALIKAVKDSDGVAIKKAAGELLKSCGDCHSDFRDN